jgi:hypothetical protein
MASSGYPCEPIDYCGSSSYQECLRDSRPLHFSMPASGKRGLGKRCPREGRLGAKGCDDSNLRPKNDLISSYSFPSTRLIEALGGRL